MAIPDNLGLGSILKLARLLAAGACLVGAVSETSAAPRREILGGCAQGDCWSITPILVTRLSRSDDDTFFRIVANEEEYLANKRQPIRRVKVLYANCSTTLPAVIFENAEKAILPESGKYGVMTLAPFQPDAENNVNQGAYNIYYAICHNIYDGGGNDTLKAQYGEALQARSGYFTIDSIDDFISQTTSSAENSGPDDGEGEFYNGRWVAKDRIEACGAASVSAAALLRLSDSYIRRYEEQCHMVRRAPDGESKVSVTALCDAEGERSFSELTISKIDKNSISLTENNSEGGATTTAYQRCDKPIEY